MADKVEVAVIAAVDEIKHEGGLTVGEEDVTKAAAEDPVYQMLIAKLQNGDWHAQRSQEVQCLKHFYNVRDRLSVA